MLKPATDMDLSVTALESAIIDLVTATGAGILGIIVSLNYAALVGEVLVEYCDAPALHIAPSDIRVTILKDLPRDSWMIYNHKAVWVTEGA